MDISNKLFLYKLFSIPSLSIDEDLIKTFRNFRSEYGVKEPINFSLTPYVNGQKLRQKLNTSADIFFF